MNDILNLSQRKKYHLVTTSFINDSFIYSCKPLQSSAQLQADSVSISWNINPDVTLLECTQIVNFYFQSLPCSKIMTTCTRSISSGTVGSSFWQRLDLMFQMFMMIIIMMSTPHICILVFDTLERLWRGTEMLSQMWGADIRLCRNSWSRMAKFLPETTWNSLKFTKIAESLWRDDSCATMPFSTPFIVNIYKKSAWKKKKKTMKANWTICHNSK